MNAGGTADLTGTAPTPPPATVRGREHVLVLTLAYAALLGTLMQSIVVPIIGRVPDYLDTSPTAASWLFTAMLISGAVCSALFGRLADIYGKRRILLVCLGMVVAGSVLGALAQDIAILIAARVLQGAAVATLPIAIGVIRDLVAGDRLVRGVALVTMTTGIGGGFGAAVAGVAAEFLGWRWLFIGSAIAAALALLAVTVVVPRIRGEAVSRLDLLGAAGLVAGLVATLLGISNGGTWGWGSPATLGCLIGGAAILVLWARHELRTPEPLIDLRLLGSRAVLFTNLASLLFGFGMYAILVAMPQMIVMPVETGFGLGESVLMAGVVGAPSIVFAIVTPLIGARIIRARGPRTVIAAGAIVLALGYAYTSLRHDSLWDFVIANALVTIGLACGVSATPVLLLRLVPRRQSAESNGVNAVVRTTGMALSTSVTSAILAGMLIRDGVGAGTLPSLDGFITAFVVAGVGCLLVLPLLWLVGRSASAEGDPIS